MKRLAALAVACAIFAIPAAASANAHCRSFIDRTSGTNVWSLQAHGVSCAYATGAIKVVANQSLGYPYPSTVCARGGNWRVFTRQETSASAEDPYLHVTLRRGHQWIGAHFSA